jgi:hypothetical protein
MLLHPEGVSMAALNSGAPIPDVEEPVRIILAAWGDEPTDFFEQPFVVVSDTMRNALDGAGVDSVQYFKAELRRERSEQILDGYWLANIVGRVSCVDRLASQFDSHDSEPGVLEAFEIDPILTCGLSIFRLAEDTRMIVVSPRIQDALRAVRPRGVLFQDPLTYNRGIPISSVELVREEPIDI